MIYRALEICATVADFCHFLDTIQKPSGIEANFGVIDAQGGAAMFEVDEHSYRMFDANDANVAPHGYIARTNFSNGGDLNVGYGYVRYLEVERVLSKACAMGGITPQLIFTDLARSFRNNILDIDLKSGDFNYPKTSGWFTDQDFIPRKDTSCSIVVQGVKKGENPQLTILWTILGYPPTSVAVPLWVKDNLPAMIEAAKPFVNDYQLVLAGAPSISQAYYDRTLQRLNWSAERLPHILRSQTYPLLSHATAAFST